MRSKKSDVRLHALRVEDAGRQPQQRVDVALVQELAPHGLAGAALEEHVVGHDDGGAAVDLEQGLDVLDEVELLVRGRRPEVGAVVGERLAVGLALLVDDRDGRLLAEGRIGDHDVDVVAGLVAQGVVGADRRLAACRRRADAVQEEVHRAQAGDAVHQLDAAQRVEAQVPLLVAVELVVVWRGSRGRRGGSRPCRRPGRR